MSRAGFVRVSDEDDAVELTMVFQTRNWKFHDNRTFAVNLTSTFDKDWFVEGLHHHLEKIEVVA